MTIPNWYEGLLLALAAFRVWRLIAHDDILNAPRRWLLRLGDWKEGRPIPKGYREGLADFLICPWCTGAWLSFAWWGAYEWSAHWTVVLAVPWAVSAVVGLVAHFAPVETS